MTTPSARRALRDAVTGERLTDGRGVPLPSCGDSFIRVREERVEFTPTPAERLSGLTVETTAIPRVIDTAQPYPGGHLGGKRWHPEFTRYLGDHTTTALAQADREDLGQWWHSAYARARVKRGFLAKYGPTRGLSAYRYALAALVCPDLLAEFAEGSGHTLAWLIRQRSLAYRFAFAKAASAA